VCVQAQFSLQYEGKWDIYAPQDGVTISSYLEIEADEWVCVLVRNCIWASGGRQEVNAVVSFKEISFGERGRWRGDHRVSKNNLG